MRQPRQLALHDPGIIFEQPLPSLYVLGAETKNFIVKNVDLVLVLHDLVTIRCFLVSPAVCVISFLVILSSAVEIVEFLQCRHGDVTVEARGDTRDRSRMSDDGDGSGQSRG